MEKPSNRSMAVVLGLAAVCNGLGVVRSLGRMNIPVVAFDYAPETHPTRHSKYAKNFYCPNLETDSDNLLKTLVDFGKKLKKPAILFPTSDAYVEFVNENREELGQYFKYALPEKSILRQLLSKKTQYLLAEELKIPIPKTFYPTSFKEVERISSQLKYPAIIKGIVSTEWRKQYPVQKVVIANNTETLLKAYSIMGNLESKILVQEVVQGPDSNSIILCTYMNKNSEELLAFTYKKVRCYPCDFGVSSIAESTYMPEVIELGLNFLKKMKFVGLGQTEFKRDIRDNTWKLIELNPCRSWMQNVLPARCGMNFPYTMYMDLTGEKKVEKQEYFKEKIKWIGMQYDFPSFRGYHVRGDLSYLEWFNSLRGEKVFEIFALDDPMPFLIHTNFGLNWLRNIFRKVSKTLTKIS